MRRNENRYGYPPLVIPADIFDTLEFAALANDGIGRADWYEDDDINKPVCVNGLIVFAGIWKELVGPEEANSDETPYPSSDIKGLISTHNNDYAVGKINELKYREANPNDKVTFYEFIDFLNIQRGK